MEQTIITVELVDGIDIYEADNIYQYDRGDVLTLTGLTLPTGCQVHFGFSANGKSKPVLLSNGEAVIPQEFTSVGAPIYAWVYVSGEDYGATKKTIKIPVAHRGEITDEQPTPEQESTIDQYIALLQETTAEVEENYTELSGEVGDLKSDFLDILVSDSPIEQVTLSNEVNTSDFYTNRNGSMSCSIDGNGILTCVPNQADTSPYILTACGKGSGTWLVGLKFKFTKLDADLGDPSSFVVRLGTSSLHDNTITVEWDEWIDFSVVDTVDLSRIYVKANGFATAPTSSQLKLEIKNLYVYDVDDLDAETCTYIASEQAENYQDGTVTYGASGDYAPDTTLSVPGKVPDSKATGDAIALKISNPTNEGTNGEVLTTDGNGGRTWEDVSSLITTDNTLSVAGMAADAKATGDKIKEVAELIEEKSYSPITLTADKGWNAYGKNVGDTYNPEYTADASGTYCAKVTVSDGEIYKIVASGGAYAYRSYVITDASNKITRITTAAFNGEITIAPGENTLYVTMPNYNSSTDGLWKAVVTTIDDKIENIREEIDDLANKNFADAVAVTEPLVTGKGYSMGSVQVGDSYTSSTTDNESVACQVISVEPNTTYYIYGKGNQYSFNLVCVLDGTDHVIQIEKTNTDFRTSPKVITPTANAAKIIVNYWQYDSLTDHTTKQLNNTLDFVFDSLEKPLKGKTILLLGDSILGNDRFNGVSEYLLHLTGATIINGAIGGTRICGDTRTLADDYTPFDGENLVEAITTGVWTEQDAHVSGVSDYVASDTLPALKAMDLDDVDIVIFNWMTNDYRASTTAEEYKAAYKNVVGMLLTANPKLRLLSVTMQWFDTNDGGTDVTELYAMGTGFDAADCTIEIAGEMHVPVLDMYRNSPVCSYTKTVYMDIDYLHPNTLGNEVYATLLWGKLKTMF